jgi:hypothetical protein
MRPSEKRQFAEASGPKTPLQNQMEQIRHTQNAAALFGEFKKQEERLRNPLGLDRHMMALRLSDRLGIQMFVYGMCGLPLSQRKWL